MTKIPDRDQDVVARTKQQLLLLPLQLYQVSVPYALSVADPYLNALPKLVSINIFCRAAVNFLEALQDFLIPYFGSIRIDRGIQAHYQSVCQLGTL